MSYGQQYDELQLIDAQHIQRRYLCSQCWGGLSVEKSDKGPRLYKVCCRQCGEDRGFVSNDFVEKKRNEDHWDALDAKKNLGAALDIEPKKPVDREKVIKALWPS